MLPGDGSRRSVSHQSASPRWVERQSGRRRDSNSTCNYYQRRGHWKNECPEKPTAGVGQVKSSALAAPVRQSVRAAPGVELQSKAVSNKSDYSAFISKGLVSLSGSDKKVPVTILRDTGVFRFFCA